MTKLLVAIVQRPCTVWRNLSFLFFVLSLFTIFGCNKKDEGNGRVEIWHTYNGAQAEFLEKMASEFIEQVKFNIEHEIPDPFTKAIKQSSKNGFLTDYLQRKSTEVQNMLLMEYDYATDIEVQREEAFEKGVSKGIQQGLQQGVSQGEYQAKIETAKNMLLASLGSIEQIAQITNLPLATVIELSKQ